MKHTRFDLWRWRIEDELRDWLIPPPAEFWAAMIPVMVAVIMIITIVLWRSGEIR